MSELESSPDFDLSFLLEIADGSNEFVVESIDMFLLQTPELMKAIAKGIAEKDLTVINHASHKLKPNLGFFGMTTCQTLMQEIEIFARNGDNNPLIAEKYEEASAIITPALEKLKEIKTEKAALL